MFRILERDDSLAKSNWKFLKGLKPSDTYKYRDVYEDQQLERSAIEGKQGPTLRIVITVILTLLVALTFHVLWSGLEYVHYKYSLIHAYDKPEYATQMRDEETRECYYVALDEEGNVLNDERYESYEDVPEPQWFLDWLEDAKARKAAELQIGDYLRSFGLKKVGANFVLCFFFFFIIYKLMMRNLDAQNVSSDTTDINQYRNDQHIALPEEIQRKFDWFPDVGAHSDVLVSSMISHFMLKNKGIKTIPVARRYKKDVLDSDGNVEHYAGEIMLDENDEPIVDMLPMFDEKFGKELFIASGAPKEYHKYYDTRRIEYNVGNGDRDKQKDCDTVADLINKDWEFPLYEPQRPAGAYIVDTAPVNTMV